MAASGLVSTHALVSGRHRATGTLGANQPDLSNATETPQRPHSLNQARSGDFIGERPANSAIHLTGLPINNLHD